MSDIPPQVPLPLRPLEYTNPYTYARPRPGILTAVGVLSIVIACVSLLLSISGIMTSLMFGIMSVRPPMMFPPPPVPAPVSASPVASGGLLVVPDDDGLPGGTRAMVIQVMKRRRSLSAERSAQLDLLLAQAGKKIFPGDASALTPAMIRSNITEAGTVPGIGADHGSMYFIVGTGRVEVFDDHAVFRPDGSMDVVSVRANEAGSDGGAGPAVVAPSPGYAQSYSSSTTITINGKSYTSTSAGGRGAATMPVMMMPKGSLPAAITMGVENLLSFMLAIFLLVGGILMLRDSRAARWMHWAYAMIKIPLVIVATAAGWLSMQGFFLSMTPGMPRGTMMPFFLFGAIFGGVVGLAYPVALMIVLKTRAVREFYERAGE